jgi:hypothetical protein
MSIQIIETDFPRLVTTGYSVKSPPSQNYNCIAWAAGATDRWWWPDSFGISSWPTSAPRVETLDAFIEAFESLGYTACQDAEYENGFQKIAIYADPHGTPKHAARQIAPSTWTSKLGKIEDIEHSLEGLEGSGYGSIAVFMKRPV